jgi:hypothetical protein
MNQTTSRVFPGAFLKCHRAVLVETLKRRTEEGVINPPPRDVDGRVRVGRPLSSPPDEGLWGVSDHGVARMFLA